eukprot:TRINITY_DN6634_c0_g1_i1.p1 TRINITY_DN6634_c0_g1~~TRINITY_DN6634_c0_g1_i1.p1  ORF type:complete len:748 (-),score=227.50 TRINITY_DN6634_c0_g1_i1:58-2301(-)
MSAVAGGWTNLKCAILNDSTLPFYNAVFVGPTESSIFNVTEDSKTVCYAELKVSDTEVIVYQVKYHKDVPNGCIVLSKPQRGAVNVSVNDPIYARPFVVDAKVNLNLNKLKLKFNVATNVKRTVKEEDIIKHVTEKLNAGENKFLFSKKQEIIVDIPKLGTSFLTVLELDLVNLGDDEKGMSLTKYRDRGYLLPKTQIKIIPDKTNPKLDWTEYIDNSVPVITDFAELGIGGLDKEFAAIFRRAFASRTFPPEVIQKLGIQHVKGMLLYGPPGTGKTLIARKIGQMLNGKPPKVINGPEILSKFVGEAEKNLRELFSDAQKDYAAFGDASPLHIIIFDEIDAICKQRGSTRDGTGVHDTIVNQLLTMIDGINSLNNILVIGMTNRKDMLDEALLRPGRLEVQVEISLPDEYGRVQIFNIHTSQLKDNGALADDVSIEELAAKTKNYSGAEIAGVVRAAQSYAMTTRIEALHASEVKTRDIGDMKVEMNHFLKALDEVRPAFGVEESQLRNYIRNGIIRFGDGFSKVEDTCTKLLHQVKNSEATPLLSVLLEGQSGSGLTALAAYLGMISDFPYAKMITPEDLVGYSESAKCSKITKIFDDAYKSPLSLIVLDNIERLLEYVRIGPRFSNQVLQTLLVLVKRIPPNKRSRIMIIGTTSSGALLDDLSLREAFQVCVKAPLVHGPADITKVFRELNCNIAEKDLDMIANSVDFPIGIKKLLMVIEMSSQTPNRLITFDEFMRCLTDYGL